MKRFRQPLGDDRASIGTLVGILLSTGVLLGFTALVVDVGQIYSERAQLQNGADAAALAVAKTCSLTHCNRDSAFAKRYADANDSDDSNSNIDAVCGDGGDLSPCVPADNPNWTDCPESPDGNYVDVHTSTYSEETNSTILPSRFSWALAGNSGDGTTVGACARAAWGAPASSDGLAVTISGCEFNAATDDGTKFADPPPATPAPGAVTESVLVLHDGGKKDAVSQAAFRATNPHTTTVPPTTTTTDPGNNGNGNGNGNGGGNGKPTTTTTTTTSQPPPTTTTTTPPSSSTTTTTTPPPSTTTTTTTPGGGSGGGDSELCPSGGSGFDEPGAFGWTAGVNDGCTTQFEAGGEYDPKTGVSGGSNDCYGEAGDALDDAYTNYPKALLIPIYGVVGGQGSGTQYTLQQMAAFVVTGFDLTGSDKGHPSVLNPDTTKCPSGAKCIFGYFTKAVTTGDIGDGDCQQMGVCVVKLTG